MKGFGPDLLWTVLSSVCRGTKSRRSQSESAKLSGATGRSTWRPFGSELTAEGLSTGLPWGSIGVTDNDWFAFLFTAATFTENCPPFRHTNGG